MGQSAFKRALGLCGLSQAEAAAFFGVSLGSVKHWCNGHNPPPEGVWRELARLRSAMAMVVDAEAERLSLFGSDPRDWGHLSPEPKEYPLPPSVVATAVAAALLDVIDRRALDAL